MDSSGRQVPLHENVSLKLPVFTNYPKEKLLRKGSDSVLIEDIKHLSNYIHSNEFWMAQIAQVDITTTKTFELMPVIGNHTIVFGSGNNYPDKFKRLLLFYQQVSAKLGFDKYSSINVQYNNQVVATKHGTISKIDSIQALKNVQRLIEASQRITVDSLLTSVDNNIMVTTPHDAPLSIAEERTNINPVKDSIQHVPTASKPPVLKPQTNPSNIQERPRAVMPRRGT
jgi:cell division protein FtsQ